MVLHIAQSAASLLQTALHETNVAAFPRLQQVIEPDSLRQRIVASLASTMSAFRERFGDQIQPRDEFKVTVLSTWEPETFDKRCDLSRNHLYSHIALLPSRETGKPIRLRILGPQRPKAETKDSQWVRDRQNLTDATGEFEDALLTSACGKLLEGTETNFFIIKDGAVVTADQHVLKGTVRASVLEICEQYGIPVVLRPPTVAELEDAQGAFITSTSRLVMAVNEIVHHNKSILFLNHTLVDRIAQAVSEDVEAKSTRVL